MSAAASQVDALDIVVVALTHRRPAEIAALVPILLTQAESLPDDYTVGRRCVLVVDNDPDASAADRVSIAADDWRSVEPAHGTVFRYVVESRAGIAAARNRALAEAADYDVLVFIDDDEIPRPDWLISLVDTHLRFQADAVAGRVMTVFPPATDPWIVNGGFLMRSHRAGIVTGTVLAAAATNNLLLDMRAVRSAGLRFDEAFGESGGEDTLFTRSFVAAGARLVWCAEAVVEDHPATGRLNRSWMLRRAFSHGASEARIELALVEGRGRRGTTRMHQIVAGAARVAVGAARTVVGMAKGGGHEARGLQMLLRGLGILAGTIGYTHREYRTSERR